MTALRYLLLFVTVMAVALGLEAAVVERSVWAIPLLLYSIVGFWVFAVVRPDD